MNPEEQSQQPVQPSQPVQPPQEQWQTPVQPQVAAKAAFSMPKWAIITIISVVTVIVVGTGGWFLYKYIARTNATDNTQDSGNTTNNSSANTDYKDDKTLDVKPYLSEILQGRWCLDPENWLDFKGVSTSGTVDIHLTMPGADGGQREYMVTPDGKLTIVSEEQLSGYIVYYDKSILITEYSGNMTVGWFERDREQAFDSYRQNATTIYNSRTAEDLYKAGVLDPSKNLLFK